MNLIDNDINCDNYFEYYKINRDKFPTQPNTIYLRGK